MFLSSSSTKLLSTFIKHSVLLMVVVIETLSSVHALPSQPRFADYPVEIYQGPRNFVAHGTDHYLASTYRKMQHAKIVFAGAYTADVIGCGTGCLNHLFLNVKTGHTADFNLNFSPDVDCDDGKSGEVAMRPNSRLLIIKGAIATGPISGDPVHCTIRYFLEKNGRLVPLT